MSHSSCAKKVRRPAAVAGSPAKQQRVPDGTRVPAFVRSTKTHLTPIITLNHLELFGDPQTVESLIWRSYGFQVTNSGDLGSL
jgi:hypothetical protein